MSTTDGGKRIHELSNEKYTLVEADEFVIDDSENTDADGNQLTKKVKYGNILKFKEYESIPVEWFEDGSTAADTAELITSGNGNLRVRKFDSTAIETLIGSWECPNNCAVSAGVSARVKFVLTEATGPSSEGVVFRITGYSTGSGDAIGGTFSTAMNTMKATGLTESQYDTITSDWTTATVTITDLAAGETVFFKLERDPTDSDDDYSQDVGLYMLDLEFYKKGL